MVSTVAIPVILSYAKECTSKVFPRGTALAFAKEVIPIPAVYPNPATEIVEADETSISLELVTEEILYDVL